MSVPGNFGRPPGRYDPLHEGRHLQPRCGHQSADPARHRRRPAPDVPEAEIIDVATEPALFRLLDAGGTDVMVLDGEAQPTGAWGSVKQAKDEIHACPPVLLIIGRPDDGWLATWSGADAVISHPIDPRALASALAGLMRQRGAVGPGPSPWAHPTWSALIGTLVKGEALTSGGDRPGRWARSWMARRRHQIAGFGVALRMKG